MLSVQQVIQPSCCFEETLPHSHWGETAQVQPMQLFSQSGCSSKNTHYETHWRETTQMQTMRLHYNTFNQSEEPQKDPLWGKASQMHNVLSKYKWFLTFVSIVGRRHHETIDVIDFPVLFGKHSLAPLLVGVLHKAHAEFLELWILDPPGLGGEQDEDVVKKVWRSKGKGWNHSDEVAELIVPLVLSCQLCLWIIRFQTHESKKKWARK